MARAGSQILTAPSKLSAVAEIVDSGVRAFSGHKKYVKTGNVQGGAIVATDDVTFQSRPSRANMEVEEYDVLFARMKATEKVLIITRSERRYLFSSGFAVLRPRTQLITPRFLFYYLQSKFFQSEKDNLAQGATQKAINNSALRGLPVPLPPVNEQKRITEVLDRVQDTRRKRDVARSYTDEAMKSIFIETFGDPRKNPHRWKMDQLGNLCNELYRYPTFYGFPYVPLGTPVVRIGNITDDGSLDPDLSNYVFIDEATASRFPRTKLDFNDTLMAVRGDGSTGKIGRVSTKLLAGANISPNLIRIQSNPTKIHPLYLFHILSSAEGQALIQTRITRTAKKKITATEFKTIDIPVPPLDVQNAFARKIESLYRIKESQQEFATTTDELFDLLMYKAFRGELRIVS